MPAPSVSDPCRGWNFSFTGAAGDVGGSGEPWRWYTTGKHALEKLVVACLHDGWGMAEATVVSEMLLILMWYFSVFKLFLVCTCAFVFLFVWWFLVFLKQGFFV